MRHKLALGQHIFDFTLETIMIDKYIYDVSIEDVMSIPKDWSDCIEFMTDSLYWEEGLPKRYEYLIDDLTFLRYAMDYMNGIQFDYGPPLDEAFILEMNKNFPYITEYRQFRAIPLAWWRQNDDFVKELVRSNYDSYRSAPKKERKDKSYALRAATINGAILEFSPRNIRNDLEIATAALRSNPFSIHFLTKQMKSKMDTDLISHCLKISKGDKHEIYKIEDKEVIANIFVSLMNCGRSVHASKLNWKNLPRKNWDAFDRRTLPHLIDQDFLLYALSINPELISYFRLGYLDRFGIMLIELSSLNPFLNREQIQNAQNLLFNEYIEKTKELPFVQPFKIIGHARRMCDIEDRANIS